MNKFLLYFSCLLFVGLSCYAQSNTKKTLLLIVAHPDDETAIADVLVKYARLGHKVVVMIATDGRDGTRVTSIPAGDSLAAIRRQESICAAEKMGIEPPLFLSVERLDTKIGTGKYFKAHKQLRDALIEKIPSVNPDIIITFGPDGDTHHSEHIVIGGAVTEVLLQKGWVEKYPLYYIAYASGVKSIDGDLGFIDNRYINLEVQYSAEDEIRALEAMKCFSSQYTKEELEEDRKLKLLDTKNSSYFRRFAIVIGTKKEFW